MPPPSSQQASRSRTTAPPPLADMRRIMATSRCMSTACAAVLSCPGDVTGSTKEMQLRSFREQEKAE
jgi:hypothetical protein